MGINCSNLGTVSSAKAALKLIELLQKATDGFNLAIMVVSIGRITKLTTQNYDLFVNLVLQKKMPVLCVVTGCENEDPLQSWVTKNIESFKDAKLVFYDMVGTCCARGGRMENLYKDLREESKAVVWESINKHASKDPIVFIGESSSFNLSLKNSWNFFCTHAPLMSNLRVIHWDLHAGLIKMGSNDKEATQFAAKFYKPESVYL
jgi:hypothetical protein